MFDNTPVPSYPKQIRQDGRVFVVIGAGQGIGRQVAHAIAQCGGLAVCVGRSRARTQRIAREVGGAAILADAQNRGDVEQLFAQVRERYGRLDGIVDTVAIGIGGSLLDLTDENYAWQHDNVLRHAFLALQLGAPLMHETGGGAVVLVSSVAARRAFEGAPLAYGMFKAALEHLGRMAAVELGPLGIRVNTVSPGLTKTPRWQEMPREYFDELMWKYPLRRIGESQDVAGAVLFLLSDLSRNITGVTLQVDGGYSVQSVSPAADGVKPWEKSLYASGS
jgi:3-oxoacyl-[acyl-carrier protein] reductase